MLPTKLSPLPRVARQLLVDDDEIGRALDRLLPLESSATRGFVSPRTTWAKAEPMWANCTRCSGRQVTLAPTSSSRTGVPPGTGTGSASAGR